MKVVKSADDVQTFGHPCASVNLFDQRVEAGHLGESKKVMGV